jgi:galactoside O-acetyltransferase
MAYLSESQLAAMGFRALGRNVRISDRAAIHDAHRIEIGDHTRIDDFCVLSGRLVLGRNVHVAVFCNLAGGEPGITVGDFAGFAYGCQVFAQSDDYSGRTMTNPTVPARFKCETKLPVVVGRHCIVGTGAVVMPGVTLAEGTSVGALTLVTKSTEPWTMVFGVPARRLKARRRDLLEREQAYLASEQDPAAAPDTAQEPT